MMMFGTYTSYAKEKNDKGVWVNKKEIVNGKSKLVKIKHVHVEDNGDPGFYPSVNKIYLQRSGGGKTMSAPASRLFERWQGLAKVWTYETGWELTDKEKIVIELEAFFPDNSPRDTHNVFKLMMDALEKVIYKNDMYAMPRVMDFHILEPDSEEAPYFLLNIYKKEDEDLYGRGNGL